MRSKQLTHGQQQGAVLLVGLIMLMLLTIIGLASIRGTDLQERMAGNMRDRNIAFQASEASLRVGEAELSKAKGLVCDGKTKTNCWPDLNKLVAPAVGYWPLDENSKKRLRPAVWIEEQWKQNSVEISSTLLKGVVEAPRYTIEQIKVSAAVANQGAGIDVESLSKMAEGEYYRVTSRGLGGTKDSEVVLQSTFIR